MTNRQKPFRPKVFLYRTLLLIFVTEFVFLGYAFVKCTDQITNASKLGANFMLQECAELNDRSEALFIAAITTTFSLLTGAGAGTPRR